MKILKLALAPLFLSGALCFLVDVAAQSTPVDGVQSGTGSICVLPNSPEPPTRISPGGMYNPDTLTVRVDKGELIRWPHKKPVLIEFLNLQDNHLVVLTSDGKRIQSFRFKFGKEDDARLCIYYDGYQGVQFGNRKTAFWCKAKTQACWRSIAITLIDPVG